MPSDDLNVPGNRELELELIRTRQSAQAARLEARAAEIELMLLAQLRGCASHVPADLSSTGSSSQAAFTPATRVSPTLRERFDAGDVAPAPEGPFPNAELASQRRAAEELIAAIQRLITSQTAGGMPAWMPGAPVGHRPRGPEVSNDAWADRLRALPVASAQDFWNAPVETRSPRTFTRPPNWLTSAQSLPTTNPASTDAMAAAAPNADPGAATAAASVGRCGEPGSNPGEETTTNLAPQTPRSHESESAAASCRRVDSSESRANALSPDLLGQTVASLAPVSRKLRPETEVDRKSMLGQQEANSPGSAALPASKPASDRAGREDDSRANATVAAGIATTAMRDGRGRGVARPVVPEGIRFADAPDAPPVRRLRPGAWMISVATHVGFLFALAALTLSMPRARDQLAFSASANATTEASVETFTLEPVDQQVTESLETSQEEPLAETSPLGEVAISEVAVDVAAATGPSAAATSAAQAADLASSQLAAASENRVQFAGVDGGGNHFVYLVDSSNSMRNFNEARQELLRSVDALQADQRFYVIFYDETPALMRLSAANEDEPTSVMATAENKLALRRWAMTIGQEKGRSPIETLEFAFRLEADAIFLLSDGEFSAATEEVIEKSNRHENLFGESQLVSIIHTIRYPGHSTAGATKAEVQMRRIAENNGGQYRNVEVR